MDAVQMLGWKFKKDRRVVGIRRRRACIYQVRI